MPQGDLSPLVPQLDATGGTLKSPSLLFVPGVPTVPT